MIYDRCKWPGCSCWPKYDSPFLYCAWHWNMWFNFCDVSLSLEDMERKHEEGASSLDG